MVIMDKINQTNLQLCFNTAICLPFHLVFLIFAQHSLLNLSSSLLVSSRTIFPFCLSNCNLSSYSSSLSTCVAPLVVLVYSPVSKMVSSWIWNVNFGFNFFRNVNYSVLPLEICLELLKEEHEVDGGQQEEGGQASGGERVQDQEHVSK